MADGYLNFDTKISTKGFNKGIADIGKAISGIGNTISGIGKAFTPVSVAVTGIGIAAAKTTIDFTKLYESTMVVFEKMLGGKQAADELYGSLLSIAKASTFSQEAFLTAGKKLVGMGVSAQDTTKYMQAITDAVAGFGGTSENLTNVAENFAKISTAGRLSMEDVNMLSDNGIQALKILGNQYGKTTDEIRGMISDGAIPAKDAMDLLADGIENGTDGVNGMTAAMAGMSLAMKGKTLTGALDSLNSGFRGFALNLTGINPTLKETDAGYEESAKRLGQLTAAISTVASIMPSVASVFSGMTDAIGKFLDKLIGTNVVFDEATGKWNNVGGILGDLQDRLNNMNPDALKKVGDAILTMASAGIGLPILGGGISKVGKIIEGLSTAVVPAEKAIRGLPKAFTNTVKSISSFKGSLKSVGDTVGSVFQLMANPDAAKMMGLNFKSGVALIGGSLSDVLKGAASFAPGFIKLLEFGAIAGALVAGLGLLQGQFGEQINGFLQIVATKGPEIIKNLCDGIVAALPNLIAQGAQLIINLMQAITANIPAIITGGVQIIAALVMGIAQQLPQLVPVALQMVLTIITSLLQNIPQFISAGLLLIVGLAQGIVNSIPVLISAMPQIIQAIVTGIVKSLPMIIIAGIQLILALIEGIIKAVPQLLSMIPQIFKAFIDGIMSVDWIEVGKQILNAIVEGIKSIGSSLWDTVKGIFSDGESEATEKGKSTGQKYAEGLKSTTDTVKASTTSVAQAGIDSFAGTLDLNGETINLAAMGVGNNANAGLQLSNVPGMFSANAQEAATGISNTLQANTSIVGASAGGLGESAKNSLTAINMPGTFSLVGASAGQGLGVALSSETGSVSSAASQVAQSAQSSITSIDLGASYSSAGTDAMQNLAGSITSGSANVTNAAKNAGDAAIKGLKSVQMPAKAKDEASKFIKSITQAITSGTPSARSASSSLANAVRAAVAGLSGAGLSAGRMFSTGLASGIRSGYGGVAAAAASVANAAIAAAKRNLQIHSPSRVGDWIGEMFDTGIAKGISGNAKDVALSVQDVGRIITKNARQTLGAFGQGATMVHTTQSVGTVSAVENSREKGGNQELTAAIIQLAKVANRPVYAKFSMDSVPMAEVMAKPMQYQLDKNQKLQSMLKGERQ